MTGINRGQMQNALSDEIKFEGDGYKVNLLIVDKRVVPQAWETRKIVRQCWSGDCLTVANSRKINGLI